MGQVVTIGLDIAKSVFQVHGVDAVGEVIIRRQVRRPQMLQFFAKQPRAHWLGLLEAAGVWCTPVNTLDEVMTDEQVRANEYLSTLDDGLRTVAMPFTLSGYQAPARAARRLGEDNDDVL